MTRKNLFFWILVIVSVSFFTGFCVGVSPQAKMPVSQAEWVFGL